MAVKIRLARLGRKDRAFYRIVVADGRSKRDGRCIERIGSYNPNYSPTQVNVDIDRLYKWLDCGAQPTETVRSICSSMGMLMLRHKEMGIRKGSISVAIAQKRFSDWHKTALAKKKKKFTAIISLDQADDILSSIEVLSKKAPLKAPKKSGKVEQVALEKKSDKQPLKGSKKITKKGKDKEKTK